jgi:hypothetical protein
MTASEPPDPPVVVAQGNLTRMRELESLLGAAGIPSVLLPPGKKSS